MTEVFFGIGFFVILPMLSWAPAFIPHLLARRNGRKMPLFSALYYQIATFVAVVGATLGGIGALFLTLFPPLAVFALPFLFGTYAELEWIWNWLVFGFFLGAISALLAAWCARRITEIHFFRWAVFPTLVCGWATALCVTQLIVEKEITGHAQKAGLSCLKTKGFLANLRGSQSGGFAEPHATAIRGPDILAWSYSKRDFYVTYTTEKNLTCAADP